MKFIMSIVILLKYVSISAVQKSDSILNMHPFFIFFSIMVYHRVLNVDPSDPQKDLVYSFFM